MVIKAVSYLHSEVTPIIRCGKRLELVIDEKLKCPIIAIASKNADEIYKILSKRFLVRRNSNAKEILIPLQALPAVSVWLLASYGVKPSEELLDKLLLNTPTLLVDLFWDLVDLSSTSVKTKDNKPLINRNKLLKASKIVRELLELYEVV